MAGDDTAPALAGIHHVKLAVADLGAALAFYEAALGARRISAFDHAGRTMGASTHTSARSRASGP